MGFLLLLIIVLLLLGGGGCYYCYDRWGPRGGVSALGAVLLILFLAFLFGGIRF
jgi:hypothetical protein